MIPRSSLYSRGMNGNAGRPRALSSAPSRSLRAGLALFVVATGCTESLSVRSGVLDEARVASTECVAVLPFENRTADVHAGRLVAQQVASALLTSERFNVLQPDETEQLLALLNLKSESDSLAAVRELGEALGVQAVLTGAVTTYAALDLSRRTPADERTVAFAARLVDAQSGNVLWTSTTTNFDSPAAIAIPEPHEIVLRDAVLASTSGLVNARAASLAMRGLCASAYGKLERGEPVRVARVERVPDATGTKTASLSTPATGALAPAESAPAVPSLASGAAAGLPPLPPSGDAGGLPALPGGDAGGLPALPGDLPSLTGDAGGLPALPGDLPSLPGDAGGLPALPGDLPSLPGDAGGLPALPGDLPSLPGDAGGLPALPDVGAAPADGDLPALPPGKPPAKLVGKLKGTSKALVQKMYKPAPAWLQVALPKKATGKYTLNGKSKKALESLAQVLKAAPGMRVRLEVYVDLTGKTATDAAMATLSTAAAGEMATYLSKKLGLGPSRVSVVGLGRSKLVTNKQGAGVNSRVEVVVVAYP